MIAREYENLAAGQLLRVTRVGELEAPSGRRSHRTLLVSVEPLGVLAVFSVGGTAQLPPEGMMAEVSRLSRVEGRGTLHLVEPGSRRMVADLPDWLCRALGRLYVRSFAGPAGLVEDLVPEWFTKYRDCYRAGREGGEPPTGRSTGRAMLWALGALERASGEDVVAAQRTAAKALADWLCSEHGQAAVLQRDVQIDLAPLLAACRLGSLLPQRVAELTIGWHAFLLLRLGDRAVSSLHTEALVTQWLTRPEHHVLDGDWRRLRTVSVSLTAGQVSSVDDFGRAVTGRPTDAESEAAPLARGLLAAVGRLPSAAHLHRDAPLLSRLAAVGRSLRPAEGAAVPPVAPAAGTERRGGHRVPEGTAVRCSADPAASLRTTDDCGRALRFRAPAAGRGAAYAGRVSQVRRAMAGRRSDRNTDRPGLGVLGGFVWISRSLIPVCR